MEVREAVEVCVQKVWVRGGKLIESRASEKVQIEGSARKKSWRLKVEERQRMALEREMVHTLVERKQQQKEVCSGSGGGC